MPPRAKHQINFFQAVPIEIFVKMSRHLPPAKLLSLLSVSKQFRRYAAIALLAKRNEDAVHYQKILLRSWASHPSLLPLHSENLRANLLLAIRNPQLPVLSKLDGLMLLSGKNYTLSQNIFNCLMNKLKNTLKTTTSSPNFEGEQPDSPRSFDFNTQDPTSTLYPNLTLVPTDSQHGLNFESAPTNTQPSLNFEVTPPDNQPKVDFDFEVTPPDNQPKFDFGFEVTPPDNQPEFDFALDLSQSSHDSEFNSSVGQPDLVFNFALPAPHDHPLMIFHPLLTDHRSRIIKTLSTLTHKLNTHQLDTSINIILPLLCDDNQEVRTATIKCLQRFTSKMNSQQTKKAIEGILDRLENDKSVQVSEVALSRIVILADKLTSHQLKISINATITHLNKNKTFFYSEAADAAVVVKLDAVKSAFSLADKLNSQQLQAAATTTLIYFLNYKHKIMTKEDLKSLPVLAKRLNSQQFDASIKAILALCNDDHEQVRENALKTIAALASTLSNHQLEASAKIALGCFSGGEDVRENAVKCLFVLINEMDNQQLGTNIKTIISFLKHNDMHVRISAIKSLSTLTSKMNNQQLKTSINTMLAYLKNKDEEPLLRESVIACLSAWASKMNSQLRKDTIKIIIEPLHDSGEYVWHVLPPAIRGVHAFANDMSNQQLQICIMTIISFLDHDEERVRETAVETLTTLASKLNAKQLKISIDNITKLFDEDQNEFTLIAVTKSLCTLASKMKSAQLQASMKIIIQRCFIEDFYYTDLREAAAITILELATMMSSQQLQTTITFFLGHLSDDPFNGTPETALKIVSQLIVLGKLPATELNAVQSKINDKSHISEIISVILSDTYKATQKKQSTEIPKLLQNSITNLSPPRME